MAERNQLCSCGRGYYGEHSGEIILNLDQWFRRICCLKELELSENLTIAPLQCLACSKRPECLRTLSGIVVLTSIKGLNSGKNVRKMRCNNPNVDLVNMKAYIKFDENLSFCSQDIERKRNFGVNQGP